MQAHVITEKQARAITGGRKPLFPQEYETACTSLQACIDLDEAKYWSDLATARAAWAKLHHDKTILRLAQQLKLKAARRMGEIAIELYPVKKRDGNIICQSPNTALKQHGLNADDAVSALRLARASKEEFKKVLENPRAPKAASRAFAGRGFVNRAVASEAYSWLMHTSSHSGHHGPTLNAVLSAIRKRPAREVAEQIAKSEAASVRTTVTALMEWLDEFEQYLPKEEK
jgi:hypothetical protein